MLELVVLDFCGAVTVEAGMSVYCYRYQHTANLPALDVDAEVAVMSVGNRCANACCISIPFRPADKIKKASLAMAVTSTGLQLIRRGRA